MCRCLPVGFVDVLYRSTKLTLPSLNHGGCASHGYAALRSAAMLRRDREADQVSTRRHPCCDGCSTSRAVRRRKRAFRTVAKKNQATLITLKLGTTDVGLATASFARQARAASECHP